MLGGIMWMVLGYSVGLIDIKVLINEMNSKL